jgi:predicted enzyme related to lactoylglutathione lyase
MAVTRRVVLRPARAEQSCTGTSTMYWHVDDVAATLEKLVSMGAREYEAMQDRGQGFITASVVDPFGNILGIMYNPHYLEVLNAMKK